MAIRTDRPLSDTQVQALSALATHGYLAEPTGSWSHIPAGAMVHQRTRDALQRRGVAQAGWVVVGLQRTHWPALVPVGHDEPIQIPVPTTLTLADKIGELADAFDVDSREAYRSAGLDPDDLPEDLPDLDSSESENYGAGIAWHEAAKALRALL